MEYKSPCVGKQSLEFRRDVFIQESASIVGQKEGEGPFGSFFDEIIEDPFFARETWEEAESAFQAEAAKVVLEKAKLPKEKIRYIFAGDLLGQAIATSFGMMQLDTPLFGLYGACSTSGESLALASMAVAAGYGEHMLAVTSSHFASAEKQFRFPLGYGSQRPPAATWTVTGSGAFIVGSEKGPVRVRAVTPGRIIDMGVKDSMNMGACMAPAACDTIVHHFEDFKTNPGDYDKIITGDLGVIGHEILLDLLKKKGYDAKEQLTDCGMTIFNDRTQDTHAGGSGCGCAAVMLSANFLPQLKDGRLKKILFIPTGALLSTVSYNEGQSVPGIAHALVLESVLA